MDYMVILFTLNNPTVICMDTHVSFKKVMTKELISILLWNIHKSKLANTTIVDARFGRTCWSMVFLIMVSNTSQKKIEMEIEHMGIGVKLTSKDNKFHNWTKACNPCKYKTSKFPKIDGVAQFFGMGLWHQKIE